MSVSGNNGQSFNTVFPVTSSFFFPSGAWTYDYVGISAVSGFGLPAWISHLAGNPDVWTTTIDLPPMPPQNVTVGVDWPNPFPRVSWSASQESDVLSGGQILLERRTKAIIDPDWTSWILLATLAGNSSTHVDQSIARACQGTCPDSVQYRLRTLDARAQPSDYSSHVTITAYGIWYKRGGDVVRALTRFELANAFPNPFNPTTIIRYALPENMHISLRVVDVLGREVATLVNEVKPAGTYTVNFDASRLSSGVYYYKLTAGILTATRKMLLTK
jgi:hypothetical protein